MLLTPLIPKICRQYCDTSAVKSDTGMNIVFLVEKDHHFYISWSFELYNGTIFPMTYVKSVQVYEYSKYGTENSYTQRLLKETTGPGTVRAEIDLSKALSNLCVLFVLNVKFEDNSTWLDSTNATCSDMPAPENVHLSFFPFGVVIHYELPVLEYLEEEGKGCEVRLCKTPEWREDGCIKKRLEEGIASASFTGLEVNATNFIIAACFTPETYGGSLIMFTTPTQSRDGAPEKVVAYDTGVDALLEVREDHDVTLSWKFSAFGHSSILPIQSVDVYIYEKLYSATEFTPKLLTSLQSETEFVIGPTPPLTSDSGCRYYSIVVEFSAGLKSFWNTNEICYDFPPPVAPTNVTVTFDSPSSVIVQFKSELVHWIVHEHNGCEVHVCKSPRFTTKCMKRWLSTEKTSASFSNLDYDTRYYVSVFCFTRIIRTEHTPWIMFETPKQKEFWIPRKYDRYDSGIDVFVNVVEGITWHISWTLTFTNRSTFPASHVNMVEVRVYKKPYNVDNSFMAIADGSSDGIVLGTSPMFTFDSDCYIYSLNVKFKDATNILHSSEEDCYNKFSTGFYVFYAILTIIAIEIVVAAFCFVNRRWNTTR
ncbi:hypothetical protein RB195_007537 [Necator americanus]|uniref:Fibronectin type-III domain-containing protein n=1 Tax=Necator americanus TaxID=51031 RepID=A0ABR1C0J9_NECAM